MYLQELGQPACPSRWHLCHHIVASTTECRNGATEISRAVHEITPDFQTPAGPQQVLKFPLQPCDALHDGSGPSDTQPQHPFLVNSKQQPASVQTPTPLQKESATDHILTVRLRTSRFCICRCRRSSNFASACGPAARARACAHSTHHITVQHAAQHTADRQQSVSHHQQRTAQHHAAQDSTAQQQGMTAHIPALHDPQCSSGQHSF
jgi:hypothetical protein